MSTSSAMRPDGRRDADLEGGADADVHEVPLGSVDDEISTQPCPLPRGPAAGRRPRLGRAGGAVSGRGRDLLEPGRADRDATVELRAGRAEAAGSAGTGGDASYAVSLLAGQGVSRGIAGACVLADLLVNTEADRSRADRVRADPAAGHRGGETRRPLISTLVPAGLAEQTAGPTYAPADPSPARSPHAPPGRDHRQTDHTDPGPPAAPVNLSSAYPTPQSFRCDVSPCG